MTPYKYLCLQRVFALYVVVSGEPVLDRVAGQEKAEVLTLQRVSSDRVAGQLDRVAGQAIYIRRKDNLKDRKTGGFIPPDLVEVEKYCAGTGGRVNAAKWFSHYKANGWKIGAAKMQDWQASVDSWAYSASTVPAAVSGAPRVNPADTHFQAMDLLRRTEAFHDRATKGDRCVYCKNPVPKHGFCRCEKYQAALGKIKGIELWRK